MSHDSHTRKLSLRRRVIYSLAVLVIFVVAAEAALALFGVKPFVATHDPFVGFHPGQRLFVADGERFVTNRQKLSFFNDVSFAVEKPADTLRIMSLGGSTTYGHPYDNRLSYNAWLEARLNAANPEVNWEVINCGGISYASYRLANLMQEIVDYEPDIVLVYTGHNEFLEERTYRDLQSQHPVLTNAIAFAAKFRTFGLLSSMLRPQQTSTEVRSLLAAEVDTILEHYGPDSYERDDSLHKNVVEHFRTSLERISELADSVDAKLIFIQPASNLRDFSPFRSQHFGLSLAEERRYKRGLKSARSQASPDVARTELESVINSDPRYSQGLFEYAQLLLEVGEVQQAREYFVRAKDEDVCPLRATESISNAMRDVAEDLGVTTLDFPAMLDARCQAELGHSIPGAESFLDHVHPDISVHRKLGSELYRLVVGASEQPVRSLTSKDETDLESQVFGKVSKYDHGMALQALAMTLSWSGKTQEALLVAEQALEQLPNDSEVVYEYGHILEKLGKHDEASAQFHEAIRLNPANSMARMSIAAALLKKGDHAAAAQQIQVAISDTPIRAPISIRAHMQLLLATCLQELGDETGAREAIENARAIDPKSVYGD